jgi:alpha-L-fucosidase 2
MIRGLLVHNTLPNLFTTHPPFQIDGNLGITGGVAETLVQSHAGEISILPALPPQWPEGSFTGLRARGGHTIDASWAAGTLTSATIHSRFQGNLKVRVPEIPPQVTITNAQSGESTTVEARDGIVEFTTPANAIHILTIKAE